MTNTARIARWAGPMGLLATAAIIFVPVFLAVTLLTVPPVAANMASLFPSYWVADELPTPVIWLALAIATIPAVLTTLALWHLRALFQLYAKGEVLNEACAFRLSRIGLWVMLIALAGFLSQPILSALLSWSAPPGHRLISVGLSSDTIGLALTGGLLTLVGWAMRDAATAAEENLGFI